MKNRRFASFSLGTVLLLPLVLLCLLQLAQGLHRARRTERLDAERRCTITVAINDLVWEEEDKEAWIDGRLFDVAHYRIADGQYHLTGVFDDHERSLLALLTNASQKGSSGLLHFVLLFQVYTQPTGPSPTVALGAPALQHVAKLTPTLPWRPKAILCPPPQACV